MKNDYHAQAQSWAIDREIQSARSRRTAWAVASIAVAVGLFEAVAIAMLAPLKTVQPITLLVDRQTGYVQALNPLQPQRITADDALTQSLLAQYVTAREGFDRATVRLDYRKVALWSAGSARSRYIASMPATNPDSPLSRYPAGTIISARIKSVSKIGQNVALVRYDTQRLDRDGRSGTSSAWIAVIRYRFVDAPMAISERLINPLGFQVTNFRRDSEAVSATDAPSPAVATPGAQPTPFAAIPSATPRPWLGQASRDVQSTVPASRRPPISSYQSNSPRVVTLNQLPMGSPLSPGAAPVAMAIQP